MVVPAIVVGIFLALLIAAVAIVMLAIVAIGAVAALIGSFAIHRRFAGAYHYEDEEVPLGGARAVLAYQARELWAAAILTFWYARGAFRNALRRPEQHDGPPVLCVHGFTQNGTNMWGIRAALERRGRPTRAVSLGRPLRRLDSYAPPLAKALAEVVYEHREEGVDIVAHSMGGVVLRVVLRDHPELARYVRRVVTLGSPHHGTHAARGTPLPGEVWQLRRGSVFLRELPGFAELAPQADVTTVAAEADYVVHPASTCHLPGTREVDLPGLGHIGLLTAPSAVRVVVRAICAETPAERALLPEPSPFISPSAAESSPTQP